MEFIGRIAANLYTSAVSDCRIYLYNDCVTFPGSRAPK